MREQQGARLDLVADPDGHGGYKYLIVDYAKQVPQDGGSTPPDIVNEAYDLLRTKYYPTFRRSSGTLLANGQFNVTWTNLTGLGQHLYRHFVPPKLKALVGNMNSGDHLHIVSDDLTIPWELIRNGGEFWGRRFIISRAKRAASLELKDSIHSIDKVVNVVGASIRRQIAQRAAELFARLGAENRLQVVTIIGDEPDATSKLYQEIPTADIIHFTCHGQIQNGNVYLQIVKDLSDAFNFMVTTIQALEIKKGCLVFANACLSGTAQQLFRQSLGFGSEFCAEGKDASAFIGTLDFVSDVAAVLFAEQYYEELFKGRSAGESLLTAKQADFEISDKRAGPSKLLYSLYGNPLVRVQSGTCPE